MENAQQSPAPNLKPLRSFIWTQMGEDYWEGECGYPRDDDTDAVRGAHTIHMMTVGWDKGRSEFKWFVEAENGHTATGYAEDVDYAQQHAQDSANEIRGLPSVYEDEDEGDEYGDYESEG